MSIYVFGVEKKLDVIAAVSAGKVITPTMATTAYTERHRKKMEYLKREAKRESENRRSKTCINVSKFLHSTPHLHWTEAGF